MSTTGGNIGIKRAWPPGFNGWAGENDMNLLLLDALAQPVVKSVTISTPPGSPAQGDAYIVGGSPTGAWAGKANQIAIFDGVQWQFAVAKNGWKLKNLGDGGTYEFNGTIWNPIYLEGTWTPLIGIGAGGPTSYGPQQVGTFTKIGERVFFTCYVVIGTVGPATGDVTIKGLPFTSNALANTYATVSFRIAGTNLTAGFYSAYMLPGSTSVALEVLSYGSPTSSANMPHTALVSNASSIMLNGSYRV